MKKFLACLVGLLSLVAPSSAAEIRLSQQGGNALIRVEGDPDNDWHIQSSTNLVAWSDLTLFGPILAGRTNSPTRSVGRSAGPSQFYRALKTAGLYDPALFRTVSLTFTQSNWGTLLTTA